LLRSLLHDLLTPHIYWRWVDLLIREIPGRTGYALRRWLVGRRFGAVGEGLVVFPGVRVLGAKGLRVGRNCRLGVDTMIQANGGVELGNNVMTGPDVKIWSVNHVYTDPDAPVSEQGYELKPVTIGNDVFIGMSSIILPGAVIGDNVVISAGAVVGGKPVKAGSIVAGNPARTIGFRVLPTGTSGESPEPEVPTSPVERGPVAPPWGVRRGGTVGSPGEASGG
jgi:acetyltransferase-like isoleucine patch superfamily enzyme